MKTRISPLIFLLALIMILTGHAFAYAVYLITIILHECGHSYIASRCGYSLDTFSLMPYGASLTGEFEGMSSKDEILIAIGGPIVNCIIVLFCSAIWWFFPQSYYFTQTFVTASLSIFFMNLLPIYPLDGSRVVLAILSKKHTRKQAFFVLRYVGIFLTLILILLCGMMVFYGYINITFFIFTLFLLGSTLIRDDVSKYQHLFSFSYRYDSMKRGMVERILYIRVDAILIDIIRNLDYKYYYIFIVVDANLQEIARLNEKEMLCIFEKGQLCRPIKDFL